MSDVFSPRREPGGPIQWCIPLPNYADQIYKLLGVVEAEAAEHGVDTSYGDWFRVTIQRMQPYGMGQRDVLVFSFEMPAGVLE